jgi:hypothetical protein
MAADEHSYWFLIKRLLFFHISLLLGNWFRPQITFDCIFRNTDSLWFSR